MVTRRINGDDFRLVRDFAHAEPVGDEWERPLYERFKDALGPGMVVFDVGASFGLYAIAAARAVGPSGRVFAFEPAEPSAAALRRHLRANGVADRVQVVEAVVTDRSGEEIFFEQETSFVASIVEGSARKEEGRFAGPVERRDVRALTLDEFCRAHAVEPDVVKIDVEGAEARVLRGARSIVGRGNVVVFLEVHEDVAADDVLDELAGWRCEQVHAEAAGTRHYVCRPATA